MSVEDFVSWLGPRCLPEKSIGDSVSWLRIHLLAEKFDGDSVLFVEDMNGGNFHQWSLFGLVSS